MVKSEQTKAVVLLSGGLDSTTVLAIAREQEFQCYCLSFSYGQRQSVELERARHNATSFQAADHLVLDLGMDKIGGSALTSESINVPKNIVDTEVSTDFNDIPVTYVPARNTIFLSYAMSWAEVLGAYDIFIGVNAMDYSGYPDCRPEYIAAFEKLANLATKAGVTQQGKFSIHTPLMFMTKKEIIEKGCSIGVDYKSTHSCYDPGSTGLACGRCDACLLRLKGFSEAGMQDPADYAK